MRALTILQLHWAYAQWYYYGYQWKEIAAKLHISRQTLTANLDKLGFDRSKRADIGNYEQAIISWMPDEKFDVITDYLQYVYERKSDYDISNGWAMSDLIELSVDYTKGGTKDVL